MGAPKQKWTPEEEAALKAGIARHGAGKWQWILKDPEFSTVLCIRSNVDLKDKWRNMSVTANGFGSREKAKLALRKCKQSHKLAQDSLAITKTMQSDEEIIDATPLAVSGGIQSIKSLILEAISNLKEPGGSNKEDIATYIEDLYTTPPNFSKFLSGKLKSLTASGILIKEHGKYRIRSVTACSEKKNSPRLLLDGRHNELPSREKDDLQTLTNSFVSAKISKITDRAALEKAAVAAADAVAKAEAAIAEAEEATREAEALEADSEAAQAFAEAAMAYLSSISPNHYDYD